MFPRQQQQKSFYRTFEQNVSTPTTTRTTTKLLLGPLSRARGQKTMVYPDTLLCNIVFQIPGDSPTFLFSLPQKHLDIKMWNLLRVSWSRKYLFLNPKKFRSNVLVLNNSWALELEYSMYSCSQYYTSTSLLRKYEVKLLSTTLLDLKMFILGPWSFPIP